VGGVETRLAGHGRADLLKPEGTVTSLVTTTHPRPRPYTQSTRAHLAFQPGTDRLNKVEHADEDEPTSLPLTAAMSGFRACSGLVIRCFKRVEHFADWATGKAGPVFIFLCWTLIVLGGITFCTSQREL
jgi:hypothetical protein